MQICPCSFQIESMVWNYWASLNSTVHWKSCRGNFINFIQECYNILKKYWNKLHLNQSNTKVCSYERVPTKWNVDIGSKNWEVWLLIIHSAQSIEWRCKEKWNFLLSHASFRITVNGTLTIHCSSYLATLVSAGKNQVSISRSSDWREENISQGRFAQVTAWWYHTLVQ